MQFRAISCNFVQFRAICCNLLQFVAICCSREEGSVHREKIVWTENYRDANISITALIFYVQSVFTIFANKRYISCLVAFPELKSINLNLIKKELNTKRTYNYFSYFIINFRLLLPLPMVCKICSTAWNRTFLCKNSNFIRTTCTKKPLGYDWANLEFSMTTLLRVKDTKQEAKESKLFTAFQLANLSK